MSTSDEEVLGPNTRRMLNTNWRAWSTTVEGSLFASRWATLMKSPRRSGGCPYRPAHDRMVAMTAIWMQTADSVWSQVPTKPFENEAALHDIVGSTPELLPLSGSPRLAVLGREVMLESGRRVDVLAVEEDGRPVIIEVKLRNNAESRRAVVAQALSYAASIHGQSPPELAVTIGGRLGAGGSVYDTVRDRFQDELVAREDFDASLAEHLSAGSFRVVIVLDEAPVELIDLVGYLESVTTGLTLDLIAVNSHEINGRNIAVPQRLDPEHRPEPPPAQTSQVRAARAGGGRLEDGIEPFRRVIHDAPAQYQPRLIMLADWFEEVAATSRVSPQTFFGVSGDVIALPRLSDQKAGLVSISNYANGAPGIRFWRSVFERRAPDFIDRVEALIGKRIGAGNQSKDITPELLGVLREAYVSVLPL